LQVMVTCCGELPALGAVMVIVPRLEIWLTFTVCFRPAAIVPLPGVIM
jgi:hypothetical protein